MSQFKSHLSTARGGNDSIQNRGDTYNVNSETDESSVTFLLSPGWTVQCSETPLVTRFFCNALTASGFHSQACTCWALAWTKYGRVKYPIPAKVTVKRVICQHLLNCSDLLLLSNIMPHLIKYQSSSGLHNLRFVPFITFCCFRKNNNDKKKT